MSNCDCFGCRLGEMLEQEVATRSREEVFETLVRAVGIFLLEMNQFGVFIEASESPFDVDNQSKH